jgi:hypothetical protein
MSPFFRTLLRGALASLLVFTTTSGAGAIEIYSNEEAGTNLQVGGFFQPYVRYLQPLCVPAVNPNADGEFPCTADALQSPSGFGMTRGRLSVEGRAHNISSFKFEIESIPQLILLEAQMNTRIVPGLTWRLGRYRVPYSGQELVSESRLSMDRAEIIRATPGRQLGTSLRTELHEFVRTLPRGFLTLEFGVFNGESDKARSPVNNIDNGFLWGGRLEVAPLGANPSRLEGDMRSADERRQFEVIVGGNFSHVDNQVEVYEEDFFGADLTLRYGGAFLYAEYMRANRNFLTQQAGVDRYAEGWNVQAGSFLPGHAYLRQHVEVVGRVEYFDPQTAAFPEDADQILPNSPGGGPASQREQGQYNIIGGVNWFLRGHDLKIQASYTHRIASEDWRGSVVDPISGIGNAAGKDDTDDSFLLQVTYRF